MTTNPTPINPAFEIDPIEGVAIGRNPKNMSVSELEVVGHMPRPVLKAIRSKCIDCSGGSAAEARRCVATSCPLWSFRMGTNPFYDRSRKTAQLRHFLADEQAA